MNMTMQQPLSYPYHMSSPHLPGPAPWSSVPFRLPYPSPSILSQQRYPLSQTIQSFSPYSNIRYDNLKRSTSYPNQHLVYPSSRRPRYPIYNDPIRIQPFQPLKTKSISDLQQISQSNSTHLTKAQSWHSMMSHRRSNLSVAYANEMHLTEKHPRKRSPQKKRKVHHPKRRLSTSPPKRKRSFNNHRKRTMPIPQCGIVRISTLDEMPINNNLKHKRNSINNDRLSNKGSISNSSKHRLILKDKSKGNNLIKNRTIKSNDNDDNEGTDIDADTQSSTSSSSHSSLQRRLNKSLRKDPLINAAIEDFRELRRSSSQSTLTAHRRHSRSRDSLCSDSTFHSFSSARSRSDSQSSFTSIERSEIRLLIKTTKTKDIQSIKNPRPSSPPFEPSKIKYSRPTKSIIKPRRSSLTEELDREFTKLRALDPDQELTYVAPSSICKRKKSIEKPYPIIPPLPTFDELLRQVQLRPVDKSSKSTTPIQDKSKDDIYENPLSSVPVPRSSPIPLYETKPLCETKPLYETKPEEIKHEYAIPIKKVKEKAELQLTYFQPIRNLKSTSPIDNIIPEKPQSRSVAMFNWLTSPLPTTFQPDRISNHQNEYGTPSVKENIYTSDIDVYLPLSTNDKNDEDALQMHLDNQTILTDDFYFDYQTKQTTTTSTNLSSILDDFSRLFTRKHEHKNTYYKKTQRCSIM